MNKGIKSGKEVLDEFFESIKAKKVLETETVGAITSLYETGKLTKTELTNALLALRETKDSGEAK